MKYIDGIEIIEEPNIKTVQMIVCKDDDDDFEWSSEDYLLFSGCEFRGEPFENDPDKVLLSLSIPDVSFKETYGYKPKFNNIHELIYALQDIVLREQEYA